MRALAAAALLAPAIATAQVWSGNTLLARIGGTPTERLAAAAYVTGVRDALQGTHCAPAGVTVGQVQDMTRIVIEQMVEHRHINAATFIRTIVETRWPCTQQTPSRGT